MPKGIACAGFRFHGLPHDLGFTEQVVERACVLLEWGSGGDDRMKQLNTAQLHTLFALANIWMAHHQLLATGID